MERVCTIVGRARWEGKGIRGDAPKGCLLNTPHEVTTSAFSLPVSNTTQAAAVPQEAAVGPATLSSHAGARLLDEDLAQAGLAEGVVLEVEAVEAVEGVLVRVHVQRVHVQVVPARRGRDMQTGDKGV